jgi:hypothetical protein
MNRRNFIKLVALVSPAIGVVYYINHTSYTELIIDTVYRHLYYLKLNHNQVVRFANDYSERYAKSNNKVASIDIAMEIRNIFPWIRKLNKRIETFENYVIIKFLESSDFFLNGSDENKQVNYLGLNFSSPYETICTNPFAVYDFD